MSTKKYVNKDDIELYDSLIKTYIGEHGGGTYSAGTGLSLNNNVFSVSTVPIANGGTGKTTAPEARVALNVYSHYYNNLEPGSTMQNMNDLWRKIY